MREEGFYWVKSNGWHVSEWSNGVWWFSGDSFCQYECEIEEIDERRIVREVE